MKVVIIALVALSSLASCTNYGKKAKTGNIEVYYKDGINEEQAKKTADLFDMAVKSSNPESSGRKSFQLTKPTDTVQLKMVTDKDQLKKMDSDASLYAILYLVSDSIFNGAPVNLVLTDDSFKGFQTITYKKQAAIE